jgi:phospholipase/carboxylesterase
METGREMTRRGFLRAGSVVLAALPLWGCSDGDSGVELDSRQGRLSARPGNPAGAFLSGGHYELEIGESRDGFIYVPIGLSSATPVAVMLLLHGAGRSSDEWIAAKSIADQLRTVLVVPDSRASTWDRVNGSFGADVTFIDDALEYAFSRLNVDTTHVGIAGFSDGGSYALSLGLTNGDLFTHVLGFSPGFVAGGTLRGKPPVYITHGTQDQVLPIATTSRRIVPQLEAAGYSVTYREFEGGHTLTTELATQAFRWFTGG